MALSAEARVLCLLFQQLYFVSLVVAWTNLHRAVFVATFLQYKERCRRIRSGITPLRPFLTSGWTSQELAVIQGMA